METPNVPTSVADLFKQFAAEKPKAKYTSANPPTNEEIKENFERIFRMAHDLLDPVMEKIQDTMLANPDGIGSDGTDGVGCERPQAVMAAIVAHLSFVLGGYISSLDCDPMIRQAAAASACSNIIINIKLAARQALSEASGEA
jgi:hypothetical protein